MMIVNELLSEMGLSQAELARKANIPKSSLSNHLLWERTGGKFGRRLGPVLSARVAEASEGRATLFDLYPDLDVANG